MLPSILLNFDILLCMSLKQISLDKSKFGHQLINFLMFLWQQNFISILLLRSYNMNQQKGKEACAELCQVQVKLA